jgi:hypothetical protein
MVSLADIPFFYAYDKRKGVRYDLSKRTYHYVPFEYRQVGNLLELTKGFYDQISPFSETPFLTENNLVVINTENRQTGSPLICSLDIKSREISHRKHLLNNVSVNRAFLLGSNYTDIQVGNVKSIVQEIQSDHSFSTPFCYINYGNGRYFVSMFFLSDNSQPCEVKTSILNFLSQLIVEETRRSYMENKEKARKSASDVAVLSEYISKALTMNYPPQDLKVVLNIPLKQLEDEIQSLKAYVNALK